MAGTILELMRSTHEDIEVMEQAGANILLAKSHRELNASSDHCLDYLAIEVQRKTCELQTLYLDSDATRSDEIALIGGEGHTDIWNAFYARVKEAKEFSRNHDEKHLIPKLFDASYWYEAAVASANEKTAHFSGEEACGRYVDMSSLHQTYLNLRRLREFKIKEYVQSQWAKHVKAAQDRARMETTTFEDFSRTKAEEYRSIDYVSWLKSFDSFTHIPRYLKYRQSEYIKYLEELAAYLVSFVRNQRPLLDVRTAMTEFEAGFEAEWTARRVEGWSDFTADSPYFVVATDRIFANENAMKGHLNSKEYAKANGRFSALSDSEREDIIRASHRCDHEMAAVESRIRFLRNILSDTIENTVDHVTRKQARTAREIAVELAELAGGDVIQDDISEDVSEAGSSEGEEIDANDRSIYNPKNLPIGPDGKPIPYWQFKLFGLDKKFTCEICGNQSYFGRRTFEKHFSEWRHVNGLRALRIPNSNHFFGITGIEDAILLQEKLRKETATSIFNADKEMECEDAMGNVMSYRAYQDLARQGLV